MSISSVNSYARSEIGISTSMWISISLTEVQVYVLWEI